MISERKDKKKDNKTYELVEDQNEVLRDLNTYLPKLMNYLWEEPKIVAFIIKKTESNDLKDYLAPFWVHNFYENILSSYYIEDNLMYLLTLLLQDEINDLTNIDQSENFLNNTPCGIMLEELKRKNDIQAFCRTIIFDGVQNLEVNFSSLKVKFKIINLSKDYLKQKEKMPKDIEKKKKKEDIYLKNDIQNTNLEDSSNNLYRNKKQMRKYVEKFNKFYVGILDKNEFQKLADKYKNNKKMYDFFNSKLNDFSSNNNDLYSNKAFFDNLYKISHSEDLLLQYQINFNIVISFIDSIIDKIIDNFHLLPYSVKCLCKIISLLITKKFPSINEVEKNSFIAKFFFVKLLIPILKNPGLEAFINNFIISRITTKNLSLICLIIKQLISGQLFKSTDENTTDYTPYNWYFIEKMEQLFNIFSHITKVKLPSFIEKLINEKLPEDYEYDYFKENPDEAINHRSMCFNLEQVKVLLNTMNEYKDEIFVNPKNNGLKKTMEKLISPNNQELLNNILDKEKYIPETPQKIQKKDKNEKEKEKEKQIEKTKEVRKRKIHFFLITTLLTNDRFKILFNIEQTTANFSIKELKTTLDEESIMKNNIIKVKNFFCSLLYNYNKLIKTDFDEGTTENTEKILKELNIFMKSSNFVVDGSIPSEWYVNSLLEYLKKIPEDLTKNDCENLYNEIENDINQSIKQLDFEAISEIRGKLKYARRRKMFYDESKNLLIDIKLNEETKEIIENEFIPVEIKFYFDEEEESGEFEIYPSNFKEKDRISEHKIKDYEKSKKTKLCITIDDFTKKFPNLGKYQDLLDVDIFQIQSNLEFPTQINNYLDIIKLTLEKKGIDGLKSINIKIYDYVMSKIYDKIYPMDPYEKDTKIFQNAVRLSWAEPKHFINSKRKFVFGSFLTDVLKYFTLLDAEKSPRKKVLNMNEIFNSIGFLLQFNGVGADAGVDDQMPILNYAFVKARPLRMFSNAKFMELYIGEKKNKFEGSQLTQLMSICDFISMIKYSDLINVSNEEYIIKCNEATNKDFSTPQ